MKTEKVRNVISKIEKLEKCFSSIGSNNEKVSLELTRFKLKLQYYLRRNYL